eukprot:5846346-Pleurochrysis_carterae.AAC.1
MILSNVQKRVRYHLRTSRRHRGRCAPPPHSAAYSRWACPGRCRRAACRRAGGESRRTCCSVACANHEVWKECMRAEDGRQRVTGRVEKAKMKARQRRAIQTGRVD